MNRTSQNTKEVEMQNAAREQVIINTRIVSLKHAKTLAGIRAIAYGDKVGEHTTAEQLVKDAQAIEAYITANIEAIKPKSALVVTNQMPPAGAGFVPGKQ